MTDSRNIVDHYKYWTTEAIKADMDTRRHNFSVLCTNIQGDFNLGSIIRNANAFLAREVIIYGRKKWDKRSAVGTYNYTTFKHVREITALQELNNEYCVIGVDNLENAVPIDEMVLPADKHVLFAFGEESCGLPQEVLDVCSQLVYIRQFGSVRSLNVGVASGIVMHEYCRRFVTGITLPNV